MFLCFWNLCRGYNGPSLLGFERVANEPNKTRFVYVLNYDMRLSRFILQSMIDKATVGTLRDYLKYVRLRADVAASEGLKPHRFLPG
jgi:hypothetical protein